jgi:hypothetical protein
MSRGLQFLAAYTFSKSIDDAGDSLGAAIGGTFGLPIAGQVVYNNQNDVAAQRGVSDFDRTHRLVISGTWSVPGPTTRQAQPSENSEVAGASRVSPRCNLDSLSAS